MASQAFYENEDRHTVKVEVRPSLDLPGSVVVTYTNVDNGVTENVIRFEDELHALLDAYRLYRHSK